MRTFAASSHDTTDMRRVFERGGNVATLDIGNPRVRRMLIQLDVDGFHALLAEMGGSTPVSRHATLAMMHKIRAQWRFRRNFTDGMMRVSKRWLAQHGYTNALHDDQLERVQSTD